MGSVQTLTLNSLLLYVNKILQDIFTCYIQCLDLFNYICANLHKYPDYAPFVHVNNLLQKTCNTFFVCLDVSNS